MDRDVPFDVLAPCYYCGKVGAFDFMGDYCCADCLATIYAPLDDELIGYTGDEED